MGRGIADITLWYGDTRTADHIRIMAEFGLTPS